MGSCDVRVAQEPARSTGFAAASSPRNPADSADSADSDDSDDDEAAAEAAAQLAQAQLAGSAMTLTMGAAPLRFEPRL